MKATALHLVFGCLGILIGWGFAQWLPDSGIAGDRGIGRYRVTNVGDRNLLLLDSASGKTWGCYWYGRGAIPEWEPVYNPDIGWMRANVTYPASQPTTRAVTREAGTAYPTAQSHGGETKTSPEDNGELDSVERLRHIAVRQQQAQASQPSDGAPVD